jgi:hypothetical protein
MSFFLISKFLNVRKFSKFLILLASAQVRAETEKQIVDTN